MSKHSLCYLSLAIMLVFFASPIGTLTRPLDDYIQKPDPHYRWHDTGLRLSGCLPLAQWEGAVLNMTSQGWLSSAEVDCAVWTHQVVVVKPRNYEHRRTALLIVGGGSNTDEAPSATDELLVLAATVAVKTRSLAVVLYQVPNQPCHFSSEKPRRGRSEDDLIAYTWTHFLDYPEESEWLLRLPMTKAVVRAMDTIQSYAAEVFNSLVDNFVVAGASKRGWATWTTAAVDDRVVGIIPVVMDLLNFVPNVHHVYRSLGGWPFAYEPYHSLNITARLDTPEFKHLMDIVDPYQYKEHLRVPKLMITTSNDEFFLLDDSAYFWDDLPGEKHILILSNAEHNLVTGLPKLLIAVEAFFISIVEGHELSLATRVPDFARTSLLQMAGENSQHERRPGFGVRPKYWWHINRDAGIIDIGAAEKPLKVILWYAYTTKGNKMRDFRWFTLDLGKCKTVAIKGFCIQPVIFHYRILKPSDLDKGIEMSYYFATIPFPKEGYGAFFVELRFAGPKVLTPFIFTTEAVIVPNQFPVEECYAEKCKGILV